MGWVSYHVNSAQARVTAENIALCYPDLDTNEQKALTQSSLIETGKLALETGAVWLRDYDWTAQRILAVHNQSLLDESLASGDGVMVLAPHLGNWEVLGLYMSQVAPLTSLYQPPDMASLEPIIRSSREKVGATLVPTDRKGVMALMKTMKAGGFTAILPDQVPRPNGGAFAPFFGTPALTMTLVNNLQQRTGCRVIAGFAVRVRGGFEIHFMDTDPDIYSDVSHTALVGLNKSVERCVHKAPAQYQWEYKRFRKQPEGFPKRYRKKP